MKKQSSSTGGKIKGLYLRGNIFWLTHGSGKGRLQVSLETSDEIEAIEKARKILENPQLNPSNGYLAELTKYADEQVASGTWTENSQESKTIVLEMFGEALGYPDLPDITRKAIQAWYDNERIRVKPSANSYFSTVKAFLQWALDNHKIRHNPAEGIKRGKDEAPARLKFATYEQRDEIIRKTKDRELKFILYCGCYAGMRKNEIVEARPDWFDLDHDLIHIYKTETFTVKNKKGHTIPLHPEFRKFLEEYGKPEPFMVAPNVVKGKARYRYDFRKPFEEHMEALGYDWLTPHVMRHTFGSLLAIAGCPLIKIAAWMGDKLATVEKHYAHLMPQDADIALLTNPKQKGAEKTKSALTWTSLTPGLRRRFLGVAKRHKLTGIALLETMVKFTLKLEGQGLLGKEIDGLEVPP